ncbi:uncharacterized protein [Choristoneura fumiferana]|uniref:uncharacterized protein n=1 Tax=Choristoneura fumiferana TaxID=7141 RepID=UPI003D159F43
MDLREIIKWFIPCFHILLKLDARMTLLFLLLFCNLSPSIVSGSELENSLNNTKNISDYEFNSKFNQSEVYDGSKLLDVDSKSEDTSVGRTFGRPMKKMMQALIPLAVAIGSAGTWAVVAALIGAKTLVVALFILKLLLVAGAAKFGGLIASKSHHAAPAPPGKEIHLHIHNGQHGHYEHEEVIPNISSWSREGVPLSTVETMTAAHAINPYQYLAPATIRTPYGNYVKIEPSTALSVG